VFGEPDSAPPNQVDTRGTIRNRAEEPEPQTRKNTHTEQTTAVQKYRSGGLPDDSIGTSEGKSHKAEGARAAVQDRAPGTRVGDPGISMLAEADPGMAAAEERNRMLAPDPGPNAYATISAILHEWAKTLLAGSLDAHMKLYATALENFYGRENVSDSLARAETQHFLTEHPNVHRLELQNLSVRQKDNQYIADFIMQWYASDDQMSIRSVRKRLKFAPVNGMLRIVAEEEVKTYSRSMSTVRQPYR